MLSHLSVSCDTSRGLGTPLDRAATCVGILWFLLSHPPTRAFESGSGGGGLEIQRRGVCVGLPVMRRMCLFPRSFGAGGVALGGFLTIDGVFVLAVRCQEQG